MYWRMITKLVVVLCFTGIVYTEKEEDDCFDPLITLNNVQSTKESIFLRWQTNRICSYTYNVSWYEDGKEDDIQQLNLKQDNSVSNVTGLTPNTGYVFSLTTDYSSQAKEFTIYTAPEAVKHLVAENATVNSVILTWDPPDNGSGNGNWSQVCVTLQDDSILCNLVNGNKYKFTGLAPCANHTFSVTSIGYELYLSSSKLKSSAVTIHHETSKIVPGKVTDLTVEDYKFFGFHIHWSPPDVAPNCVAQYSVDVHTENYNKSFTVDGTETFCYVADNLGPCTEVNVSVTSIGDEGPSTDTAILTAKTAPAFVSNLHSVSSGPSWVVLKWYPPVKGSKCLSHYDIYVELSDGHPGSKIPVINITAGSTYIKYNYTGFGPCENRHVYVRTVNEYGIYSSYPQGIEVYSKELYSGVVLDMEVYNNKSSPYYTHVIWEPADIPSKCLSIYEVVAGTFYPSTARIQDTSYTFFNLDACTNYTFYVYAMGPHEDIFRIYSTRALIPYYDVNILKNISVTEPSSQETHLYIIFYPEIGTDCIQSYHVCWYIENKNLSCSSYNYYLGIDIPESLDNIREIHVNAVFSDGAVSNKIVYYNSGMIILQSPIFMFLCLILHSILRRNSPD